MYTALVIDGADKDVRSVITRVSDQAIFHDDAHIEAGSFLRHVAEWVGLKTNQVHVVVPDADVAAVQAAAAAVDGVTVRSSRAVSGARFDFDFELFGASKEAAEVRAILANKPDSVKLQGYAMPAERPKSDGVELDDRRKKLVEEGHGTAFGPLPDVISLLSALREGTTVITRPIHLILVDEG